MQSPINGLNTKQLHTGKQFKSIIVALTSFFDSFYFISSILLLIPFTLYNVLGYSISFTLGVTLSALATTIISTFVSIYTYSQFKVGKDKLEDERFQKKATIHHFQSTFEKIKEFRPEIIDKATARDITSALNNQSIPILSNYVDSLLEKLVGHSASQPRLVHQAKLASYVVKFYQQFRATFTGLKNFRTITMACITALIAYGINLPTVGFGLLIAVGVGALFYSLSANKGQAITQQQVSDMTHMQSMKEKLKAIDIAVRNIPSLPEQQVEQDRQASPTLTPTDKREIAWITMGSVAESFYFIGSVWILVPLAFLVLQASISLPVGIILSSIATATVALFVPSFAASKYKLSCTDRINQYSQKDHTLHRLMAIVKHIKNNKIIPENDPLFDQLIAAQQADAIPAQQVLATVSKLYQQLLPELVTPPIIKEDDKYTHGIIAFYKKFKRSLTGWKNIRTIMTAVITAALGFGIGGVSTMGIGLMIAGGLGGFVYGYITIKGENYAQKSKEDMQSWQTISDKLHVIERRIEQYNCAAQFTTANLLFFGAAVLGNCYNTMAKNAKTAATMPAPEQQHMSAPVIRQRRATI